MKITFSHGLVVLSFFCSSLICSASPTPLVRLKELGRFDGWRENYVTGVGLVTGLAGTGDSARSKATRQSLSNLMARFDINIPENAISTRNVAAVVVTAALPPFARSGDRLDVTVTSIGDAKSLLGGNLLLMPLKGPDDQVYCLAQGPVNVSGYKFESNDSYQQTNHPTAGMISTGCTVENTVLSTVLKDRTSVRYLLNTPDYTVVGNITKAINATVPGVEANARDAGSIDIFFKEKINDERLVNFLSSIEAIAVEPAKIARIVVNERSGLIVSGTDVQISPVTITQGDLRISVTTASVVSQPLVFGRAGNGVQTVSSRDSKINVKAMDEKTITLQSGNTVNDLVTELTRQKVAIRQIVSVLQALRAAGALYADIIVQ